MRIALALALACGGLLAACQPASPNLVGRTFLSVGITDNGAPKLLVPGTQIRLAFTDTAISAHAGCNSMGGDYRLDAGRLVVGTMFQTEMACDEPRMAQDEWLIRVLGSKPTLTVAGDQLTIAGGGVVMQLTDRRIAEPDLALTGPTWTVDSIITGDTVSSVPQGAVATLVFGADGTLEVNAGCNRGTARWKAVGGGIEVTDIGLTKMACFGAAGELESAVLATLRGGTIAATIEADQLILRAGTAGLGLRGR